MNANIPVLTVNNLSVHFGREPHLIRALNGVNFAVNPGETLGIVGESGSGKSMAALAIMGLLPPGARLAEGTIRFRSKNNELVDLNHLPAKQRRLFNGLGMGMIFQEPMSSLNPVFTCGDQVAEGLRFHRKWNEQQAKDFTLQLFDKVKLSDLSGIYQAYPHQLSGGQKQRVMIAMALACAPRLVISDEPTTALDVSVQRGILNLLNELKEEANTSFIFISHDLAVINEVADRVLVMYRGQIVESGLLEDVFHRPQHPYTKGLIACRPRLDQKVRRLPVLTDFMSSTGEAITEPAFRHSNQKESGRANPGAGSPPLVRVSNLKVWFPGRGASGSGPVKAVDGVDFTIFKGESLGLAGESGCGKTTIGKALMRLISLTSGEIFFGDHPIHALPEKELGSWRRAAQMIFQDPYGSLNPRMWIGSALMEPMKVLRIIPAQAEREKRARQLLDMVQLPQNSFDRYPHEFSGGQRQRIGIARALAVNPDFIICDESVSSLDVSVQAQILNLLLDLQEELALTYLFISHDLSVVKFFSDRLLIMQAGKIVEEGPPDKIYRQPQTNYTRQLIDSIPKATF